MYLSFYCKGSKRLFKVCVWEAARDRTETAIFWPLLLWPSALCLSRSPDAQPDSQRPSSLLDDGFLYSILSATSLVPKLHRGSRGALRPGVAFPTKSRPSPSPTLTGTVWLLSWLSYIIVQRPLNRLRDLWNRMLDRRQAEITVMQIRGHSLPVRQSMSVPWEFFTLSHFISQFPSTRFPLITAEWHFWPGRRSKYNNKSLNLISFDHKTTI